MSKKRALGRGLEALIPTGSPLGSDEQRPQAGNETGGVREVSVHVIAANPQQPRQRMDPEKLSELAASIREHGLIQPLIVSDSMPDRAPGIEYHLIAGERRLEAAKLAGLSTVTVIVKEATPQQMLELALVENIQRADLNPLEEAAAYYHLIQEFGLTQQEIASKVGKNRVSVANALRLLRLPDFVKGVLTNGQISEGHARALLGLEDDQEMMIRALKTVIKQHLSVRQTEELVRRLRGSPLSSQANGVVSPETRALESQFAQALGTKVKLMRSKKGGRLTIHFYSEEELQGLYEFMVRHSRS
jgi:ParB family chromosome partitioning protein